MEVDTISVIIVVYLFVITTPTTNQILMKSQSFESSYSHNLTGFEVITVTLLDTESRHNSDCEKILQLVAFSEKFTLCLKSYSEIIFTDTPIVIYDEFKKRTEKLNSHRFKNIFKGYVIDSPISVAYGKLVNTKFDGYFMVDSKYYFLEPISNFDVSNTSDFCIIYNSSSVKSKLRFDTYEDMELPRTHFSKWPIYHREAFELASKWKTYNNSQHHNSHRSKRSTSSMSCPVNLVADHTFYEHVGRTSIQETVSELIYRLGDADVIFRATDFDGDGFGDNIGFHISKMIIYTSKQSVGYTLADETLSAHNYLEKFSMYNFDSYCLAVAFTYRDFEGGTLGLAWVGSSSFHTAGGICQQQIMYKDSQLYSLNTALVTMENYGNRILSYQFGLVLTHELGHNFGSPHDPTSNSLCSPNNENGNYIMFPYAGDGSKPNHNIFSPCSINSMYPVMKNKGWCFEPFSGSHCGNFFVEPDEECDCGDRTTCLLIDHCCSPSDSPTNPDPPCKLKRSLGYECSIKNSPCCTKECKYVSKSANQVCSPNSECKNHAVCNGTSGNCPPNENKIDGTVCDNGRKICDSGTCSKSICNKHGLYACKCKDNVEHECILCCKRLNTSKCLPTSVFPEFNYEILSIKPGELCNSILGICDDRGKCLTHSTSDIVESMFSEETANDIKSWFRKYWYYCVTGLAVLAFLVTIFVLTKKKRDNIQVDAFRMGRLQNFICSAEAEIKHQEDLLQRTEEECSIKIKGVKRESFSLPYVEAIVRLAYLFPTAPSDVVAEVARKASNESVAVRLLLVKGFPVRKTVKRPLDVITGNSVN